MCKGPQIPIRRKLVIVGDGACGKTSLLSAFAVGEFFKDYQPKIFESYVAEILLDDKSVDLALWDTAGQEGYEALRPLSYAEAHVILIAFAIDTLDSLENVKVKWVKEVRNVCGPTIPILLVGCKADLRPHPSTPDIDKYALKEQAELVASDIGARAYKECSALKIEGVDDVFEAATRASLLMREGVPARNIRRACETNGKVRSDLVEGKGTGCKCIIC